MPLRPREQRSPNHRLQAAREDALGPKSRARFARAVKRRCEELYGGHCGVDHRKVRRWEEGACEPDLCHQQAICDLLKVPWDERGQLGFPAPGRGRVAAANAAFGLVERRCPLCAGLGGTAGLGATASDGKDDHTNRGQFLRGASAGVVVAATERLQRLASILKPPVKDASDAGSARRVADALSSTYNTAKSGHLLGPARQHLSGVVDGLDRVMLPGQRGQLLAVGVDMACLCGWLTRSSGAAGDAHAYFALAVDLAEASAQPELLARALGSQSILRSSLHVPGRENGRPREALELLEQATPGAEAGRFRSWLAVRAAEEHALLGERDACFRHLELAYAELGRGEGNGFFSTQAFWPYSWAAYLDWRRGRCLALLGEAEPALAELKGADDGRSIRKTAEIHADTALAWVVAGEPEPTCAAAMRGLDVSEANGYAVSGQRIRGVRARFPQPWAPLACVRELDERLGVR